MPPRKMSAKRGRTGASSSRSAPQMFVRSRFTTEENFMWYEKMKENKMIVEKSIHPRIDMEVPIRAEFEKFGWGPLLDIRGDYFPELVWQFYANIEDKERVGFQIIQTFVKGVRIELSSDFLAQMLGVPNEGPPVVYNHYDAFASDEDYSWRNAIMRLRYSRVQTGGRHGILPTSIPLIDRLICYFLSANIIPRKPGNNELRNLDVYIIDKLLNGLRSIPALPVASIMIGHMRLIGQISVDKTGKQYAPFAIIISRLLAVFGVDFTGEASLSPPASHMLTAQVMTGMYFICRRGAWYRNPTSHHLTRQSRDPPVPPATAGEQAREERVEEEAEMDAPVGPQGGARRITQAPRGTRQVFSALFDCMDDIRTRLARIEHQTRTQDCSDDIHAPPYDRSTLDDLEESEDSEDEED